MLKDVNVFYRKTQKSVFKIPTPLGGLLYNLHIYLSHKLEFPGKMLFHEYVLLFFKHSCHVPVQS